MRRTLLSFTLLVFFQASTAQDLRFEVSFDAAAHAESITGRVFVIAAPTDEREPRLQTGGDVSLGVPFWGTDVTALVPDQIANVDQSAFGFPYEKPGDLPPGDYFVQAVVNIYSEFRRSDGHVLWMHDDRWEGQQPFHSPGNLYSDVQRIRVGSGGSSTVTLHANRVVPPVEVAPDTQWVKRVKFRSPMLSAFWGRDIFLGATVLLPAGYETHPDVSYPVIYQQGHFSLNPPLGFREPGSTMSASSQAFVDYWTGDDAPRLIGVTFQHPTPYYDDSYAVNSDNVGPYGDAIMQELIPFLEERFRMKSAPWARTLTGGSTGGWEALALQVYQPDDFGGTWSLCPDPVDFRYYELINIYEHDNAFFRDWNGIKTELPEARDTDGRPRYTVRNTVYYEQALGSRHRSGRQWAAWEASYSPIGADGYPQPLWNWRTGEIDHAVAEQWRKYDLRHVLQSNWSELGPKLAGKLHIFTGDMDTYFLDSAVILLEQFLESTTNPYYAGSVTYGDRQPHCWGPRGRDLIERIDAHLLRSAPAGLNVSSWRY